MEHFNGGRSGSLTLSSNAHAVTSSIRNFIQTKQIDRMEKHEDYHFGDDPNDKVELLKWEDGKPRRLVRIETDGNWEERNEFLTVFPGLKEGDLVELHLLEQGIEQMNRLPSNSAKIQLLPGAEPDEVIVRIANKRGKPFRFSTGIINYGRDVSGETKLTNHFEFDNLLGVNDSWKFDYDTAIKAPKGKSDKYYSGFFSIPYAHWTFTLFGESYLYQTPHGKAGEIEHRGDVKVYSVELERVVQHDKNSKTVAGMELTNKEHNGYFDDVKQDFSTELAILTSSLHHNRELLGGKVSGQLAYSRGLELFGADKDPAEVTSTTPRPQFDKLKLKLSYHLPFEFEDQKLGWTSAFTGQWSPDTLPALERLVIGGNSTVRGFKDSYLFGDNGGYLRNELSWSLPKTDVESLDGLIGGTQLFLTHDAGMLLKDKDSPNERGTVQSLSAGLRLNGGLIRGQLVFAKPLSAPSFIDKQSHEIYARITLNF
ncbi:ShlB/FhaC/HecB family hemolysin secretion/activation protein [Kiloniella sp. b19]|uniref:ShlB/FhaC/HecB family hemolysin secretion/activation protein n=1 Tax=Kiloniella sp. GXU_MW_B19 TaxID=3141326 RepID=UPI0031DB795E